MTIEIHGHIEPERWTDDADSSDDPDCLGPFLTECRDKGFIDRDTKCLDNTTLHDRCVYKGAKTCAALLEKWGWT